jgi:hypothetical protein
MRKLPLVAVFVVLSVWFGSANAQYVVVLKNGRQLTVQSYRDEGSTVKILGLGGELGIPKEQIQSISKSGSSDRPGLNLSNIENSSRPAPAPVRSAPSTPPTASSESSRGSDPNAELRANEEKEYRKKLAEVTQKLEAARKRYLEATQGGSIGANTTKEGLQAWTADLTSRIQDSQKAGGGPASTPLSQPHPSSYTPKGKELSDLRTEIEALEKERNNLIQEMKSKNIDV